MIILNFSVCESEFAHLFWLVPSSSLRMTITWFAHLHSEIIFISQHVAYVRVDVCVATVPSLLLIHRTEWHKLHKIHLFKPLPAATFIQFLQLIVIHMEHKSVAPAHGRLNRHSKLNVLPTATTTTTKTTATHHCHIPPKSCALCGIFVLGLSVNVTSAFCVHNVNKQLWNSMQIFSSTSKQRFTRFVLSDSQILNEKKTYRHTHRDTERKCAGDTQRGTDRKSFQPQQITFLVRTQLCDLKLIFVVSN